MKAIPYLFILLSLSSYASELTMANMPENMVFIATNNIPIPANESFIPLNFSKETSWTSIGVYCALEVEKAQHERIIEKGQRFRVLPFKNERPIIRFNYVRSPAVKLGSYDLPGNVQGAAITVGCFESKGMSDHLFRESS